MPQLGNQHQVLATGEDLIDRGELSGQTDGFSNSEGVRRDVESIDGGAAGVWSQQRGQDSHDRGLACSVRAEKGEDAARRHLEVHASKDVHLLVGLLHALHTDRGLAVPQA
jgi:hypothetical protein